MSDEVAAARPTRRKPKKRLHWIWWVLLAVLVIGVAAIVLPMLNGGGTTSNVTTAQVTRQTLQATVSGSGNAIVSDVTEVQPGISGTVQDLSVKLGQSVTAGEQLFTISNPSLDTAVEKDEASYQQSRQQVRSAKANLTQARNNLYNIQHPGNAGAKPLQDEVYERSVKLAEQQVCAAEVGVTAAEEGLDGSSQTLSVDRDNADKRTVTAPVSGVITALNAANGVALSGGGNSSSSSGSSSSGSASAASVSSSANSAVEIADLSTLKAEIQINEVDLVNVKVGQSASVTFDALPSGPVSGTVTAVAPTGVNSSGVVSYNVDITLASVDKRLRPTMSCSADINTATHTDALVVSSAAVHTNATSQTHYVVVLASDGSERQVTVTTGLIVGTQTEILSGLQAGQTVVTSSTSSTTSGSTSTNASSSTTASGSSSSTRRPAGGGGLGILFGR